MVSMSISLYCRGVAGSVGGCLRKQGVSRVRLRLFPQMIITTKLRVGSVVLQRNIAMFRLADVLFRNKSIYIIFNFQKKF